MVCVRVAFHEKDGNHENDENDEDNSDSYKQGVECWIRGNHGNHKNDENHGNPGRTPRVPQTTGLEIPDLGTSWQKSRDIPPKSLVSLSFEGHTKLFGPPSLTWKTPTPPEDIRTEKFGFVLIFLPERQLKPPTSPSLSTDALSWQAPVK